MLHTLQQAFREAVRNFHEALEEPPSGIGSATLPPQRGESEHVGTEGIASELVLLQSTLGRLEEDVRRTRNALASERKALEACERRGVLATEIHDSETVQLARDFAEQHRAHLAILVEKEDLLRRELMHHRQRLEHLLMMTEPEAPR
jgi:hypothetical protein